MEKLCPSLPSDLVLRILSFLPSPLLFECRSLSKAAHALSLRVLSRRPFIVYQAPSSHCYLLPLDALTTPLLCTFTLGINSFVLAGTSSNLLCLHRKYHSMLDLCVCEIFHKWKVTVPPIVHPDYAPRLIRRVFLEDSNVDSLRFMGFHALVDVDHGPASDGDGHGHGHGHDFRIFVANDLYMRVFDSCQKQWSDPIHFPPSLRGTIRTNEPIPPHFFIASDGSLTLTVSARRAAFTFDDAAFHFMECHPPNYPRFELAGHPAVAYVDSASFKLNIHLPHVQRANNSKPGQGLLLEEVCRSSHGFRSRFSSRISQRHEHSYRRELLHSSCHAHQNMVYAIVMEKEQIICFNRDHPGHLNTMQWRALPEEGHWKYMFPDPDSILTCHQILPAITPCKLMLYMAHIDTTSWTMHLIKEDATALLQLSAGTPENQDGCAGRFLLVKG